MNIIFLTVSRIKEIKSRGIYTDLMRKFRDEGHNVYIVTPYERQFALPTSLSEVDGIHLLGGTNSEYSEDEYYRKRNRNYSIGDSI